DDNQYMISVTGSGSAGMRYLRSYHLAGGTRTFASGPDVPLTPGNWYQLKMVVTNNGDNTYDILSTLYNADSSGAVGSLVTSLANNNYTNTVVKSPKLGRVIR
ncbi:MAG: hypothetical protein AB3N33_05255, partial [Puniceicoccaceae bacterium]